MRSNIEPLITQRARVCTRIVVWLILLVNLSFTEQLSLSIFGIRRFFKTPDSAFFLKLRGHTLFIRRQIELRRLF